MYRTRQQMEAIIGRGASVMLPGGGVATTVAELPSEATLARWDKEHADKLASDPKADEAIRKLADTLSSAAEERQARATADLQAKIAELQSQLAQGQDAPPKAPPPKAAPAPASQPVAAPAPAPRPEPPKAEPQLVVKAEPPRAEGKK